MAKYEIINVEHGEFDRIEVKGYRGRIDVFRRYNADYWDHLLGETWERYRDPSIIEGVYQKWVWEHGTRHKPDTE